VIARDKEEVQAFFNRAFLHWVEALSLIDKISEGIATVTELESVIQVSSRRTGSWSRQGPTKHGAAMGCQDRCGVRQHGLVLAGRAAGRVGVLRQHGASLGHQDGRGARHARGPRRLHQHGCVLAGRPYNDTAEADVFERSSAQVVEAILGPRYFRPAKVEREDR
jgi:hypothetical protein